MGPPPKPNSCPTWADEILGTGKVSAVAHELAGRASARLLAALGIAVSRHAMLRVLLKIPLPALAVRGSWGSTYPDLRIIPTAHWCGDVVDAVVAGGLLAARGPPGSG
jgi:hypothetical protein